MTTIVFAVVAAALVPLATVICVCGVVLTRDPARRRDAVLALWVLVNRGKAISLTGPERDGQPLARTLASDDRGSPPTVEHGSGNSPAMPNRAELDDRPPGTCSRAVEHHQRRR
jgi:hypothetical protein